MSKCIELIDELTTTFETDVTLSTTDIPLTDTTSLTLNTFHEDHQINTRELQLCETILEDMMTSLDAIPFLAPVDWVALNIPDYPLIIQNPMDLQTVETKLENFKYENADHFARDMRLIWYNAQIYNPPGTGIYNDAHVMSQEFEIKFNKIFVERMNINPLHKELFLNKTIKQKLLRQESTNTKLTVTQLDDMKLYFHANVSIIPKFELGVSLKFITTPTTKQDFTYNFRVCCKYGLNDFVERYLDAVTLPYKQFLNESVFPNVICEIIVEYLKSNFSLLDLMIMGNSYGESGLCLASKYGQSNTCKLLINRCKTYVPKHVIIGWINAGTSGQTPLQWSLTSFSSDSWAKIQHNVLDTIMVLLNNGAVVCLGSLTERCNAYELALKKGLKLEGFVLKAYLSVETGEFKTPLEYALQNQNETLINLLKNYVEKLC